MPATNLPDVTLLPTGELEPATGPRSGSLLPGLGLGQGTPAKKIKLAPPGEDEVTPIKPEQASDAPPGKGDAHLGTAKTPDSEESSHR